MPAMTIGQLFEVMVISALPFIMKKIGYKKTILIGVFAEFLRFFLQTFGGSYPLTLIALGIQGFTFSLIYIPALIYLDHKVNEKTRSGVQQLYTVFSIGIGSVIGNQLCGIVGNIFYNPNENIINYNIYWIIPSAMSLIIFAAALIFFKRNKKINS